MNLANVFNGVTLMIPFIKHNDSVRANMVFNHLRQAMPLLKAEIPIIRTGFEHHIATNSQTYFRKDVYSFKPLSATLYEINNKLAIMSPFTIYDEQEKVVYDPLFIKKVKTVNNKTHFEYSFGVNLYVGYMNYYGYTYQDGCVISKSAAEKLKTYHTYTYTVTLPSKFMLQPIKSKEGNVSYFPIIGDTYETILQYYSNNQLYKEVIRPSILTDVIIDVYPGYIINDVNILNIVNKQENKYTKFKKYIGLQRIQPNIKYPIVIHFILTEEIGCGIGDKIANRHGNKAVINLVVDDEDMPYDTVLKRRLDLIYSPLSIPSRMNLGQLMEQLTTKLLYLTKGKKLHKEILLQLEKHRPFAQNIIKSLNIDDVESIVVYPFKELNVYELKELANKYNVSEISKCILHGQEIYINTGFQYIMRLEHMAITKITGAGISHQYLQSDGQRIGEMETWNILAHDGYNTLTELFNRSNNLASKIRYYINELEDINYYDDIPDVDLEYAYIKSIL